VAEASGGDGYYCQVSPPHQILQLEGIHRRDACATI
jgi:hypothetical protein